METVNALADAGFTKVCFVSRQYRCRIECSLSTTKSSRPLSFPRFTSIASSHAIIFSGVVRAARQYLARARGNPLCASIFSRNISRNDHIHFSITFSHSPSPLRPSSHFNVLFPKPSGGAERPKLSQVYLAFLPLLYRPALHSPFCFSIVAQHPAEHPRVSPFPISLARFSSCTVVNIHSRGA